MDRSLGMRVVCVAALACGEPDRGVDPETASGETSTTDLPSTSAGVTTAGEEDEGTSGSSAVCGDGVVDPGEACDDGNATEGDGCNTACQPSGALLHSSYRYGGFESLVVDSAGTEYLFRNLASPDHGFPPDIRLTQDIGGEEQWEAVVELDPGRLKDCHLAADSLLCLHESAASPFLGVTGVLVELDFQGQLNWQVQLGHEFSSLMNGAMFGSRETAYVALSWLDGADPQRLFAVDRGSGEAQWVATGWKEGVSWGLRSGAVIPGVGVVVSTLGGTDSPWLHIFDPVDGAHISSHQFGDTSASFGFVLGTPDDELLVVRAEGQGGISAYVMGEDGMELGWTLGTDRVAIRAASFDAEGFLVIGGGDGPLDPFHPEDGEIPPQANARIWKVDGDGELQWGWSRTVAVNEEVRAVSIDADNRIHAAWVSTDVVAAPAHPDRTGVVTLAP